MWWVCNEVDITLIFTKKIYCSVNSTVPAFNSSSCVCPKCIRKNLGLADAPSQVAATTLMAHCVSQIVTAFQNNENI